MTTPTTPHFRLDVQGLRAVAVIAVVLFHAGLVLPGGFVGVDMFFVISGFVITLTLLRTKTTTGKISLKQFYLRRFRRLAPALAVVILFTLIASAFVLSPLGTQQNAAFTALAAALSLGNWAIAVTTGSYFDAPAELNPFLHTWSLGVEEQFYVVFPLAIVAGLFLAKNRLSTRATVTWVVAALSAVSFFFTVGKGVLPDAIASSTLLGFYSPITRAWEFGVGALIALWSLGLTKPVPKAVGSGLSVLGVVGLGYSFIAITGQSQFPGLVTVIPVLATAALIVGGTSDGGWLARLLSAKPLVAIGDWSYSIYLWHWPFVSLAKVVWEGNIVAAQIAALVSFVPAIAMFYLIEQRFRYRTFTSGRDIAVAIIGFVGGPAVVAVVFWLTPTALFGNQLAEAVERPISYALGCHVSPSEVEEPGVCVWPADDSAPTKPPLYLVGDSNAAHFADGLVAVAEEENRSLTIMTASVCPFFLDGGISQRLVREGGHCQDWQEAVGDILNTSEPGVVIMSTSDHYWLVEAAPLRLTGQELTQTAKDTLEGLRLSLEQTTETLSAAGHDVMFVQTVPHWREQYRWDLAKCSLFDVLDGCNETMPTSFYLTRSQDFRNAVSAAGPSGVTVVDFLDTLCPGGVCQTAGDGYWVYRDDNHISTETSRRLAPVWQEFLTGIR